MIRKAFSTLALSLVLTACSIDLKSPGIQVTPNLPDIKIDTQLGQNLVSCSAMVAPEAGPAVVSGQPAPIKVKAKGGVGPYQVVSTAIAFDAETVLSRTYTNTGTTNSIVVDTVVIKDSVGLVAQCNFLVTVAPAGTTPSTLACTLDATPSLPQVNQDVVFTATAQGGSGTYTFSQFASGTNGTLVSALAPTSATQAKATVKYTSQGLRTATVKLTDGNGTEVVCAKAMDVVPAPSIQVVATPSTAVTVGSIITLTATPSGFTSAPTYTFTTTRSGVSIAQNGATATVYSSVAQTTFDVLVTATNGTQSASSTISLQFNAVQNLTCSVSHTSGILNVGQNVQVNVTASNGDPLLITYFATQSDASLVSSSDASRTVKYTVAGIKNVLVKAKSKTSGIECQAGGYIADTLEITAGSTTPTLSCTGYTSVNPSYAGDSFYAWANISGGTGWTKVNTLNIIYNGTTYSYSPTWVNANTAIVRITFPGSFQIKFNLLDSAGNTGSCTTTQVVW